jgi:hypothetical protein
MLEPYTSEYLSDMEDKVMSEKKVGSIIPLPVKADLDFPFQRPISN